jgi:hypothetical protein
MDRRRAWTRPTSWLGPTKQVSLSEAKPVLHCIVAAAGQARRRGCVDGMLRADRYGKERWASECNPVCGDGGRRGWRKGGKSENKDGDEAGQDKERDKSRSSVRPRFVGMDGTAIATATATDMVLVLVPVLVLVLVMVLVLVLVLLGRGRQGGVRNAIARSLGRGREREEARLLSARVLSCAGMAWGRWVVIKHNSRLRVKARKVPAAPQEADPEAAAAF